MILALASVINYDRQSDAPNGASLLAASIMIVISLYYRPQIDFLRWKMFDWLRQSEHIFLKHRLLFGGNKSTFCASLFCYRLNVWRFNQVEKEQFRIGHLQSGKRTFPVKNTTADRTRQFKKTYSIQLNWNEFFLFFFGLKKNIFQMGHLQSGKRTFSYRQISTDWSCHFRQYS